MLEEQFRGVKTNWY